MERLGKRLRINSRTIRLKNIPPSPLTKDERAFVFAWSRLLDQLTIEPELNI